MSVQLRIPVATYRLQFNRDFRFRDAISLVSYLDILGILDIYASPLLKARMGSSHGYDVTDPTRLNPELGTDDDFDTLIENLKQRDMGLLLDIVPNHMAASPENPWWQDVMEKGQNSPFAGFFDTHWLDFPGSDTTTGHRRFFDIGDLIGIRVEESRVFKITHSLIFRLLSEGKIIGLRIDHIDGLFDPLEYLRRLRKYTGGQYTVVEKILSAGENLPEAWPVCGTTGYDFANVLNALIVDSDGIKDLEGIYSRFTRSDKSFRDLVYEKKKQVINELFPDEIAALGRWLAHLSGKFTAEETSQALIESTACLPVYRTYIQTSKIAPRGKKYLEKALTEARQHGAVGNDALEFLKEVLLLNFPPDFQPEEKTAWMNFIRRWQQLTGAVMAKGFEDTALYNYHRLISLNEVGGNPDTPGLSIKGFHRWNLARMKNWPYTLNTTSTHDTKRSEDVRARINVLSEIPGEWEQHLICWQKWNEEKKLKVNGLPVPEPNTEILLYQTLIGAWPLTIMEVPGFKKRLKEYMVKAVREAKTITSWIKINREYENAILKFIDNILQDSGNNEFLTDFLEFQKKIARFGALNSLSQLLLKITSPGIPDFYQGTELWDFSLVDPDNRRPVDFSRRKRLLDGLLKRKPPIDEMLASWEDGRIKLYVIYKALNTRRTHRELFQKGKYTPLRVEGKRQESVCAFIRRYGDRWSLVVVPRFFTKLVEVDGLLTGKRVWREDRVILPDDAPRDWHNAFTDENISSDKGIALADLFSKFPIAMLIIE
ncbi:MAG TPA: malto-oligosyltrehalose synthase [Dehalococcoidia bacterium]|nr:malto-oligosyltrehalose synthase [Dehalococcoidia bacterium]